MKKIIALLITALTSLTLAAQDAPLKFGVNAGATYAGVYGNRIAEQNDYAVDFLVGVSLEVPLSEKFSLSANINYERISFERYRPFDEIFFGQDDPAFMEGGFDVRLTIHYITIPVNLKYYIGASKRFYINGGPFAGIYVGESGKVDGNKVKTEGGDLYKSINAGINLGFGTSIPLNAKNNLNIELRDNLGLINISDVPVVDNGTLKTNSVNLIVGWQFSL